MTKKGRQVFKRKNMATPSVAAPGETNLSDATDMTKTFRLTLFLDTV